MCPNPQADACTTKGNTVNEDKTKTQAVAGTGSLQRSEESERGKIKEQLRKKIRSIREGHNTGGYCETEALQAEEKKLHAILSTELEEAKAKFGYSPDPKFKPSQVRTIELELNGLSYKPKLVVAAE